MQTKDADIVARSAKWAEEISAPAIRELTDEEIALVSGGGEAQKK